MHSAIIYIDQVKAEVLAPDITQPIGRAKLTIAMKGDCFYIYIEAPDTVSLKASLTSIARLIHVIEEVEGVLDGRAKY
ncbi:TVG1277807 [Thermoplasma volcanium GSS1]|uniref:TVG1277807 protein n=1 Tax=Thermoplasma volcanium (strain ATCC 51530 / DSM 4299 / JCM 9571 / NBRC 15438 / GSS1) TaxID=273116 RepID=Q979C5_THEVO|nr:KEOPS complex subunit Pcc1 [Thermoplasma volcanium]BAB60378.1 TVG1277807 [Thermoplasma volcanium GSS1]